MTAHLEELRALAECDRAELPRVLGLIAELEARIRLRLAEPPVASPKEESPEDLITPEAAARIAGLPMDTDEVRRSVRRIYEWAKGARWASRPSRKCLRISERGFRRWLAARNA